MCWVRGEPVALMHFTICVANGGGSDGELSDLKRNPCGLVSCWLPPSIPLSLFLSPFLSFLIRLC